MSIELLRKKKRTRAALEAILAHPATTLVVHYSCESFYDNLDGRSRRITSIAIRTVGSGQTQSFSIHQMAELQHVDFSAIEKEYDSLERKMLDLFFEFIRAHSGHKWIHWNMRDINFGFFALEHRYTILGGTPSKIEEADKFDLARAMIDLYGYTYADHPRLENLVKMNKIGDRGFLGGAAEAKAFETKKYVELHQSTLRKVDIINDIAIRARDKTLKVKKQFRDNLIYPAAAVDLAKDHWFVVALGLVASILSLFGYAAKALGWIAAITHR